MDPDCAICSAPASMSCDCEANGLERAIREAEDQVMRPLYTRVRAWVRSHAQDYILRYFRILTEKRKTAHSAHLDHLTAHAYHHYNAPPAPQAIQEAHAQLKRGIDADWQASVARYPEVLAYFYSLVELHLPAEDDPVVCDPPLGALQPSRKSRRRGGRQSVPPPAIAQAAYGSGPISPRTPPPTGRRTPGAVRRPSYRQSASYPHYHMV